MPSHLADRFPDKITNWADLAALVEHFSYFSGYDWLFRGATDVAHDLTPKVGREETRAIKAQSGRALRLAYRIEDERAVLAMFKQQARPLVTHAPVSEIEWLALAQHFGLPTRLLDWTDSLFVAAWFAVEKGGAKECDSGIWVTRGIPSIERQHYDAPLELREARIYRPPHITPRISAQGSVFLICPTPTTPPTLHSMNQIRIERGAEFTLKKRLNACGINRRQLFPDLGGLSEHLAWMYKNDWLAGYREKRDSSTAQPSPDVLGETE
jgi:hypothetical protein